MNGNSNEITGFSGELVRMNYCRTSDILPARRELNDVPNATIHVKTDRVTSPARPAECIWKITTIAFRSAGISSSLTLPAGTCTPPCAHSQTYETCRRLRNCVSSPRPRSRLQWHRLARRLLREWFQKNTQCHRGQASLRRKYVCRPRLKEERPIQNPRKLATSSARLADFNPSREAVSAPWG